MRRRGGKILPLDSTATLADCVTRLNLLLALLQSQ
jgi:hypothetical protein